MNITLSFDSEAVDREFVPVEVSSDMSVNDFLAYIEAESTIPPNSQILIYKGDTLPTTTDAHREQKLSSLGLQDGDMILVRDIRQVSAPPQQPSSSSQPQNSQEPTVSSNSTARPQLPVGNDLDRLYVEFERIRNHILSNPVIRSGVYQQYPHLESVVHDSEAFRNAMLKIEQERVESEKRKQEALKKLHDDPFDPESQEIILRAIHEEAIMENFNAAMENNPEAFASVTMLFIDTVVNRRRVKAFVDSGAQATIMSPHCAEACGIAHLIDKRFQGTAMGVGTAKILGRIHSVPVNIGGQFLDTSFTVMEGKGVDFLLGLDMLKKHRAVIDLKQNQLHIADINVAFLPESEIPHTGLFSQDRRNADSSSTNTSAEPPKPAGAATPKTLGSPPAGAVPNSKSAIPSSNASRAGPSSTSSAIPPQHASGPAAVAAPNTSAASSSSSSARHLFPAAQPSPRQTGYPESDIASLMSLGFTREQVIEALNLSGGNVEHAAAILFP